MKLSDRLQGVINDFSEVFKDPHKISRLGLNVTKKGKELSNELSTLEKKVNAKIETSDNLYFEVTHYIKEIAKLFDEILVEYNEKVDSITFTYIKKTLKIDLSQNQIEQVKTILLCPHQAEFIRTCRLYNMSPDDYTLKNNSDLNEFTKNIITAAVTLAFHQSSSTLNSDESNSNKIQKDTKKLSKKQLDIDFDKELFGSSRDVIKKVTDQSISNIEASEKLMEKINFFVDESETYIEKCEDLMSQLTEEDTDQDQ